jgi:hypothetical protein
MSRLRVLLLFVPAVLAPAQPRVGGEYAQDPVELPAFTVATERELPPPESWLYASFDRFEVLSNASRGDTQRLLREFRRFLEVLEILQFGSKGPLSPKALILCDRDGTFRDFTPNGQRDAHGSVSLFLRDREGQSIVIDRETRLLQRADFEMLLPGSSRLEELSVDHLRQLYRGYIRSLFFEQEFPPPPWVIEGVSQIVVDVEFSDRSIYLGRLKGVMENPSVPPGGDLAAEDVNTMPPGWAAFHGGSAMGLIYGGIPADDPVPVFDNLQFSRALRGRKLLPMEQLFAVTADSLEARNPLGNSLWAKQAYAFIHLCLFGRDDSLVKPYARFVERLSHEPLSETLFQDCFAMSYAEMERQLEAYIRRPSHRYRRLKLAQDRRIVGEDLPLRQATQGEIARIKGGTQRLAGRNADALAAFRLAYARGERDAPLLAVLGVEEFRAGEVDRARKFLEVATRVGNSRPSAWTTLARLRLDEARGNPAEAGKLSSAQVAQIIAPLLQARSLEPALPETYHIMAEAWEQSAELPNPAQVHLVGEGAMYFPTDAELVFRTAQLYAKAGDLQNAGEVARMALRFASDDATRDRCGRFLDSLAVPPPIRAVPR